jgi:hypothetical protein
MIYFCFIEGDDQHDVEMKLLEAVEDGPAMQEAGALRFGGRTGYVFDGDRSVGSVKTSREPGGRRTLLRQDRSRTIRRGPLPGRGRLTLLDDQRLRSNLTRSLPATRQARKPAARQASLCTSRGVGSTSSAHHSGRRAPLGSMARSLSSISAKLSSSASIFCLFR